MSIIQRNPEQPRAPIALDHRVEKREVVAAAGNDEIHTMARILLVTPDTSMENCTDVEQAASPFESVSAVRDLRLVF